LLDLGDDQFSVELFSKVYKGLKGIFSDRILQDISRRRNGPRAPIESDKLQERREKLRTELLIAWLNTMPSRDRPLGAISRDGFASQYVIPHILVDSFVRSRQSMFHNRRIAAVGDEKLALVPASAQVGDIICCLAGSSIPYVLRRHKSSKGIPNDAIYESFIFPADTFEDSSDVNLGWGSSPVEYELREIVDEATGNAVHWYAEKSVRGKIPKPPPRKEEKFWDTQYDCIQCRIRKVRIYPPIHSRSRC
jgi:hypothetical protein